MGSLSHYLHIFFATSQVFFSRRKSLVAINMPSLQADDFFCSWETWSFFHNAWECRWPSGDHVSPQTRWSKETFDKQPLSLSKVAFFNSVEQTYAQVKLDHETPRFGVENKDIWNHTVVQLNQSMWPFFVSILNVFCKFLYFSYMEHLGMKSDHPNHVIHGKVNISTPLHKRNRFVSVEMKTSQGTTQTQSQLGKTDILLSQELRNVENF